MEGNEKREGAVTALVAWCWRVPLSFHGKEQNQPTCLGSGRRMVY